MLKVKTLPLVSLHRLSHSIQIERKISKGRTLMKMKKRTRPFNKIQMKRVNQVKEDLWLIYYQPIFKELSPILSL